MSPACLGVVEYLPADVKPCFALFPCTAFALPSEQSLSQPMNSSAFTFLILSPSHLGRVSEWLGDAEPPARVKSNI